jgi:hypothetical protein
MQLRVTYRVLFHVAFDVDNECRANGDGYCRLQRVSVFLKDSEECKKEQRMERRKGKNGGGGWGLDVQFRGF